MQTTVCRAVAPVAQAKTVAPKAPVMAVPRPLQTAALSVAGLALAFSANAATIKMGADNGSLVFEPSSVTVAKGEAVTFTNNAGFPHNVVFDEDDVPSGVNADAISHEDYFNAPGETYTVKLDTPGTYGFYCEPHQGAGMTGKITVQ